MADKIERTIYKVEMDDSGYIRGIDRVVVSTEQFENRLKRASDALANNQRNLRTQSEQLELTRKRLTDYTGTNERYRSQLEKAFTDAQKNVTRLTELVAKNQAAYDSARRSADEFASSSKRAAGVTGFPSAPTAFAAPTATILQEIKVKVDATELDELPEILLETQEQFDDLRTAILQMEESLDLLDPNSEAFADFAEFIDKGKTALMQFDEASKKTGKGTLSLRTELTQARNELVRLEQAGKAGSKEFTDLEIKVTKLTKAYNDQQARIRVLSSETRALDFGQAVIGTAINSFQVLTAVQVLAGKENEELQKKTMQLFAAMQLLASIEQIVTQFKRGGVIATNLQSASYGAQTAVVNAATGALTAYRAALIATGIGAAIVGIGLLAQRFNELQEAEEAAAEKQKTFRDINVKAGESVAEVRVQINEMTTKLGLARKGLLDKATVLDQYNTGLGKVVGTTNDLNIAEQTLIDKAEDVIKLTLLKAKAQATGEQAVAKIKETLANEEKSFEEFITLEEDIGIRIQNLFALPQELEAKRAIQADQNKKREKARNEALIEDLFKAQADILTEAAEFAKKKGLIVDPTKTIEGDKKRQVQNEFERERRRIAERLQELRSEELQGETKIRADAQISLIKEQQRIEQLLKEKKVTTRQAQVLQFGVIEVNTQELDKSLSEFRKKVTETREKLTEELETIRNKTTEENINLITDEFTRRKTLIDFNQTREIDDAREFVAERLRVLQEDRRTQVITEEDYQTAKAVIVQNGEQRINNIIRQASEERKKLGADIFEDSLDQLDATLNEQLLQLTETTTKKIQIEKALFKTGEIDFKEFQKRLTAILKEEKKERDRLRLLELNDTLSKINAQLDTPLPKAVEERLRKRQQQVRKEISEIGRDDSGGGTKDDVDTKSKIDKIKEYVDALGSLAQAAIQFWQAANDAEREALDRSIALQEQRVDAARRIAERGNAQYLRMEEDRLKELQIARENAARRDIAINAAVQASQILVAITGAIADIAKGGPAGIALTISKIAVIVSSLAAGFALVKSLQSQQPTFYKGTPELKRRGEPAGRDTIPAWLNEGEAVIPTEKNRRYKKAVEAIYYGKVPAEVMNEFVETYVRKNVKKKRTEETNITEHERFVTNVNKVPVKVLNKFIEDYEKKHPVQKHFKGTPYVERPAPAWLAEGEAIIPAKETRKYRKAVDAILNEQITAEQLNEFVEVYNTDRVSKIPTQSIINEIRSSQTNTLITDKGTERIYDLTTQRLETYKGFVDSVSRISEKQLREFVSRGTKEINTYKNVYAGSNEYSNDFSKYEHGNSVVRNNYTNASAIYDKLSTVINNHYAAKQITLPHYERIKQAAEIKTVQDSKLSKLLDAQNRLLTENNDLQRQSLRALRSMGVTFNWDKNGVEVSIMEAIQQRERDKRI